MRIRHEVTDAGGSFKKRAAGFSLLELVLVVVIIGIISGMVASGSYSRSMLHQQVEGAARRIAVDLEAARRQAAASSSSRTVSFDADEHTYTLPEMADPDRPGQRYQVDLKRAPYEVTIVKVDFGGDATVVFDGYGVPDDGGAVVIAAGDFTRTITVHADSGRASVE